MPILKANTTYMLSKSGDVICTGRQHPYVNWRNGLPRHKPKPKNVNTTDVIIRTYDLKWFVDNTSNDETKELALKCLEVACKHRKHRDYSKVSIQAFNTQYQHVKKDLELFNALESLTNEEFCRVRTSNVKFYGGGDNGEIYFRISSTNFNWFDTIWKVVLDNKNFIKYVTIVRDETVGTNSEEYYVLDGKQTFQMPVDEFLTLSGNPIIK